ncbi:MAG: M48 family peptidase [Balneola sp.]|nr:MAG: M48 family peptidase [Balneola sp.]
MNFFRSEKKYQKTWRGISVEITRKRIKNLYVRVNRRTGLVRVSAPIHISEKAIEGFLDSKFSWIKRHQLHSVNNVSANPFLTYENGEVHYFFGKQFQLKQIDRTPGSRKRVYISGNELVIEISEASSIEQRKRILEAWYRSELKERIPQLVQHYESKMNVKVNEYRVRKMRTRWGSCNIRDKRIWLSLELAKKRVECLEMVIVHEMTHLLERLHNKRFYKLMDIYMPEWKEFEVELNTLID